MSIKSRFGSTKSRLGSTKYHLLFCPECPRSEDGDDPTYDIADLQEHLGNEHLEDVCIYRCPECCRNFTTAFRAKKHMKTCYPQLFAFDQNDYTRPLVEVSEIGLKKINHWLGVAIKNYGIEQRGIDSQMSNLKQSVHNIRLKKIEEEVAPKDTNNISPMSGNVRKQPENNESLPELTPNSSLMTVPAAQSRIFFSSEQIRTLNQRGQRIVHDQTTDYNPSAPPLEEEDFEEKTHIPSSSGDLQPEIDPILLSYPLGLPISSSSPRTVFSSPSKEGLHSEISSLSNKFCQQVRIVSPIPISTYSYNGLTKVKQPVDDLENHEEIRNTMKMLKCEYQHHRRCKKQGRCDPGCPKIRRINELINADAQFLNKIREYSLRLFESIKTAYGC